MGQRDGTVGKSRIGKRKIVAGICVEMGKAWNGDCGSEKPQPRPLDRPSSV